jgi:ribosomal protein S18 acetylase RimI-like enzyme
VGYDVDIVLGGRERIADLEPLYIELHEHHVAIAPQMAGLPPRTPAESWAGRRALYEEWLEVPGALVLLAERDGKLVGYALVSTASGYQAWTSGDRVGEVRDLVVAGAARGAGVGSALMDSVERELAAQGIDELRLMVLDGNEDAFRFYESRGMTCVAHVLLCHVGER